MYLRGFCLNCLRYVGIFLFDAFMAVTKVKKAEILKELEEKFSKAKAVYFTRNNGLHVKKTTELRKKLHRDGIDFVVAKKTLIRLAAKKMNAPELTDEIMQGPIAVAFSYDEPITPARLLYEFGKENENLQLVGGVFEGRLMDKAAAKQLATLPPKEQLLAKLVGSMKSPLYGLHGALSGVLRKFVYVLKAVHDAKAP